jgi:hypothetical protein
VDLLGGVGFIEYIDAHALSNSRPQHRPRELTVVGSGYYLSSIPGVTLPQLNLTLADAKHMPARLLGKCKGIQGQKARQLQNRPASEQAG